MPTPARSAPLLLSTLATAALLAACSGGGDEPTGTAASPAPASVALSAGGQQAAAVEAAIEAAARSADAAELAPPVLPAAAPAPGAPGQTQQALVIRASATLSSGVGPNLLLRVDGQVVGSAEVRSTTGQDLSFSVPALRSGSKVDIAFTNDANVNGQDRNLFIDWVSNGTSTLLPTMPGAVIDNGSGDRAFDGVDTKPGQRGLYSNGALRLTWPSATIYSASVLARRYAASRFLTQATFGPTQGEIDALASSTPTRWIDAQMALPLRADFVDHVQSKYDQSADQRPNGSKYTNTWVQERFWATAANGSDQLRKRVAFALHHIFMVSLADSNLWHHQRAYAQYLDTLNRHAFGNFRQLLEDISLSPVMGIYLSHMRNRKEDAASGRVPDENYAREVMQLLSIGLHELKPDGSLKLDAQGQAVETYNNQDVMALAKVFTGWSWAFPDRDLTEQKFRWGWPDYAVDRDQKIDLKNMRAYPGQFSTAAVTLFAGKPHAVSIPAGGTAEARLKLALDALFNHPNVGPFIGRQLIQQLVTSDPSPAYVGRVAAVFANNGKGVRGDMGAVVRAVLLDAEARNEPGPHTGKLREPVLRVTHWLRAFAPKSVSGQYTMAYELDKVSQRSLNAPSVFGWFRPGYVPPGTSFAARGATAPEFQIVNESTTAAWVNTVEAMSSWGLGWNGKSTDVTADFAPQLRLIATGDVQTLVANLNLLLFAGRMSPELQRDIVDAVGGVNGNDADSQLNRARIAAYVAMSSPEFQIQR